MDRSTAIQSAQLRQLLSVSKVSLATSISVAAVLVLMQRDAIPSTTLISWSVAIAAAALLRGASFFVYARVPVESAAAVRARLAWFRVGVMLAGAVWGVAGILLFPANDPQHLMFLIFALAGMTAGGVISFSADLMSAIVFSLATVLPLVGRLLWEGDSSLVAMAVVCALYLGFMLMTLRRINRAMVENIMLHLEAATREEQVRASEDRYRLLLNHSPVGIIHYDTNLTITYCNDHLVDMLHSPTERIVGLDMKQLKNQSILPPLRKALAGERSYFEGHYNATISDASGWIAMTCAPSLGADGKVAGGIAIIQDITERVQTEERLRSSLQQLEEKELAKTRFLAAAGHDLRQPVAAANLFVDALKFSSPNPRQAELIERLDESMNIFSSMLERLLDISKFDAGRIKPNFAAFNLAEIFNWLEHNFALAALDKQLSFRLFLPLDRPLVVRSDIGLLQSVLMNLVSNAIKFTARGGILVGVRQRGDHVLLQVWDTGIGIADADINHIFDEFYQVANPQRNRAAGLGLGLSICQRAMSLLGGEIACRSRVGRGSVFELSLPLSSEFGGIEQPRSAHTETEIANELMFDGKRVVVVEDDTLVATGLVNLLQGLGAEVRHFRNAEEAMRQHDIASADFFIADYSLGGERSGLEFLTAVQQQRQAPLHAVILTGETSSQFISSVTDSPWPVLHKPVHYAKLASSLRGQTL